MSPHSSPSFKDLVVLNDHPLIQHKLSQMRDKYTKAQTFRRLLREIALLMGYEVTRCLPSYEIQVETPLQMTKARKINEEDIVIVPILRAGLGMSEALRELLPGAREGHIGVYRDHETKEAIEYLVKLPHPENRIFILVDPMLATANSASHAINILNRHGVQNSHILFLSLVSAPEGVTKIHEKHSGVSIFTAALDEKLNENAYIVPGLGDAGDRLFGTDEVHP